MIVEEITENKVRVCEEVLRALPEWFGIEDAIRNYIEDARSRPMLAARDGDAVAGFLSLSLHNEFTGEIHVMGIKKEYHRKGIGKELVAHAEAYLAKRKFEFLTVKTLSPSRKSVEYDATRQFYLAMGFRPLEEFKTLWGEANPCLFLAKTIKSR